MKYSDTKSGAKGLVLPALLAGGACLAYIAVRKKKKQKAIYRNCRTTEGRGQTALVTGASSGIGLEFARIYAARGYDVVITARSTDKLGRIADELHTEYGVKVTPVTCDLSQPDGAQKLYDTVHGMDIEVDEFINNAGAGHVGNTVDVDPQILRDLIQLNVTSVTLLSRLFGADMKKRGRGRILIVSSIGAFIPDPYFNVYGPSKAFDLFLGEAMYGELKNSGVTVCVLCPGPTKTGWAANAGKADTCTALDARTVAEEGFEGLQKGRLIILPSPLFKLEKFVMGLLPVRLQIAIIRFLQNILIHRKN